MIRKIKQLGLIVSLLGMLGFMAPALVVAQPANDACEGLRNAGLPCNLDEERSENQVGTIIRRVINILSVVVGAVAVLMIIIGGFRYIVSGGDQNGVSGAKNTILYALIGLVIVIFAQVIVRFVFSNT